MSWIDRHRVMSSRLRIVTWNIHKGIGIDRKYRLDRSVAVLGELDADVACLQEVDEGVRRSARERQGQRLARELGYPHYALGLNVKVQGGAYGNLTLSRHPLRDVHNVDLTIRPKKRRSGLVVTVMTGPTHGWAIANVHLGLLHLERRVQIRRLLTHLFRGVAEDQPLVIAGDWNEWGSGLVHQVMGEWGFHLARNDTRPQGERTWPSRRPLVGLDKILYRHPVDCHRIATVLNRVTRVASDHLPLLVELEAPVPMPAEPLPACVENDVGATGRR